MDGRHASAYRTRPTGQPVRFTLLTWLLLSKKHRQPWCEGSPRRVHDGAAADVLVAHQVAVGVPGLDGRLVAEQRLEDLGRPAAPDLNGGEVVRRGVRGDLLRRDRPRVVDRAGADEVAEVAHRIV